MNGVSYTVPPGGILGVVGESGCGKSVHALAIMRLIQIPPGKIESGQVIFDGRDLLQLTDAEMRHVRGRDIAMVFQDPMSSLNPVYTVGFQIMEALKLHKGMDDKQARERAGELLTLVGIPSARNRLDDYPHQFSGGMRQRAMIAMASLVRAASADCGRANDCFGRYDPGPDHRPGHAPPAGAWDGGDVDHA